jgi:hypothetical protein
MTHTKIAPPASVYDDLRTGVLENLRQTCSLDGCGELAFTTGHHHLRWAAEYAERLVKLALLTDALCGGETPRVPREWMRAHPAEKREAADALRRPA